MSENEKNDLFVKNFFTKQDVVIGEDTFKIRILSQKGNYILGQLSKAKLIKLHKDQGPKIEDVKTQDFPYIYFYANVTLGEQNIFFQIDSQSLVYSSINNLLKHLDAIAKKVVSNELDVSFSYSPYSPKFWDTVEIFDVVERVSFVFVPPNFLGAEDEISKILEEAKNTINSNRIGIEYENKEGLNLKEQKEYLDPQSNYTEKYSGTWIIKGKKNNVTQTRKKEDFAESRSVKIDESLIDDSIAFLDFIIQNLEE